MSKNIKQVVAELTQEFGFAPTPEQINWAEYLNANYPDRQQQSIGERYLRVCQSKHFHSGSHKPSYATGVTQGRLGLRSNGYREA